jgi:hypothetical protein
MPNKEISLAFLVFTKISGTETILVKIENILQILNKDIITNGFFPTNGKADRISPNPSVLAKNPCACWTQSLDRS